jgi:hypothetical protein
MRASGSTTSGAPLLRASVNKLLVPRSRERSTHRSRQLHQHWRHAHVTGSDGGWRPQPVPSPPLLALAPELSHMVCRLSIAGPYERDAFGADPDTATSITAVPLRGVLPQADPDTAIMPRSRRPRLTTPLFSCSSCTHFALGGGDKMRQNPAPDCAAHTSLHPARGSGHPPNG